MTIQWRETGNTEGKTIVFLHASGVSSWMWYKQEPFFKDHRCIWLDLPEHGLSREEKPFIVPLAAERVIEAIQAIAPDQKVFLIGHEMGARVVLAVLQKAANLIEKAVVSSVVLRNGSEARLHQIIPHSVMVGIFKLKLLALKTRSFQKIAAQEYGVAEDQYVEQYLKEIRGYPAEQLLHLIHESFIVSFDLQGLENVQVPTLAMVGEKELKPVQQSSMDVVRILPNSKGVVVKNGTQTHPRVESDTFNEIVRAWIEDVPEFQHQNVIDLVALA